MAEKISSLDSGYESGNLSIFPEAVDSADTLYTVRNNAETTLTQSLAFTGKFIVVGDTSPFPDKGLIRVGTELIYYAEKATGTFKTLIRGFAGSKQNQWPKGTRVAHSVEAEPHNAIKDAIINMEDYAGLETDPAADSLNGILKAQENRFLAPKPIFRGIPLKGPPPLQVRFQNFSNREAVRFLWDFGDGGVSTEINPTHVYLAEGVYTVQLRMVTIQGGQGVVTKTGYVLVDENESPPFIYVTPEMGTTSTTFTFVDQTDGDIVTRHWIFDDGDRETVDDPDVHTITHQYTTADEYDPTLLVVFADTRLTRVNLVAPIIVS